MNTKRHLKAVGAAGRTAAEMVRVAHEHRNCTLEQVAGRTAEAFLAGTQNIDAAKKGIDVISITTESIGQGRAKADILTFENGVLVGQAQVKTMNDAARAAFELSHPDYQGMTPVAASEQLDRVKAICEKRGEHGLGYRNYRDTAKHVTSKLERGGAESQHLSHRRALEIARDPRAAGQQLVRGEVNEASARRFLDARRVRMQAGKVLAKAATNGAAVSGVVSGVTNTRAALRGEKSGSEALVDTLADAGQAGANALAVGGVALVVEKIAPAPGAIASVVVETGKELYRLKQGDIDAPTCIRRVGGHCVTSSAGLAGAKLGAICGSFVPGIGTIVGGLLGGIGGALFGARLSARVSPS